MKTYQIDGRTAEEREDGTTKVSGHCVFTGEYYECCVSTAGLQQWLAGELVQNALPEASADAREFILSGVSPGGWQQAFGDDDATP